MKTQIDHDTAYKFGELVGMINGFIAMVKTNSDLSHIDTDALEIKVKALEEALSTDLGL